MKSDRSLTPTQQLSAAHAYFVLKIDQHEIATVLNVNAGRIAEACNAARTAFKIVGIPKKQKHK